MAGSTMHAVAVTPGIRDSARLVQVPLAPIRPDEVLVRTVRVGVCGTDAEINGGLYGAAPQGSGFLILGHESFGQVAQVGRNVRGILPGEFVVAMVRRPDGCPNCEKKEQDMCLWGGYVERGVKGMHGFLAEYFVDQPDYLVKVSPAVASFGVLVEPLSIVEKAVRQTFKIQERMTWQPRTALVLGAGPIGLLATFLLRSRGLRTYTASRNPDDSLKAQLARAVGGTYVSVGRQPLSEMSKQMGNLDVIIEATGNSGMALESMGLLGTNGVLCLTSVTGGRSEARIDASALNQGMVLGNKLIFGTVNASIQDVRQAVEELAVFEGLWPGLLGRMITRRSPYTDFAAALHRGADDIKVVIEFGAS
ncbi:MAG: glucose 1-dehydrogenase [Chloroflexi bacterium]|nr:glucose 1-dehydrogenase [Chloroflexota bacterium]